MGITGQGVGPDQAVLQIQALENQSMGHSSQAVFVSAFSIANCFGRLCAG